MACVSVKPLTFIFRSRNTSELLNRAKINKPATSFLYRSGLLFQYRISFGEINTGKIAGISIGLFDPDLAGTALFFQRKMEIADFGIRIKNILHRIIIINRFDAFDMAAGDADESRNALELAKEVAEGMARDPRLLRPLTEVAMAQAEAGLAKASRFSGFFLGVFSAFLSAVRSTFGAGAGAFFYFFSGYRAVTFSAGLRE